LCNGPERDLVAGFAGLIVRAAFLRVIRTSEPANPARDAATPREPNQRLLRRLVAPHLGSLSSTDETTADVRRARPPRAAFAPATPQTRFYARCSQWTLSGSCHRCAPRLRQPPHLIARLRRRLPLPDAATATGALATRFEAALNAGDVESALALLAQDAEMKMPPDRYVGLTQIRNRVS
jgi:hypothetical protein